jgi:hypothetical protein
MGMGKKPPPKVSGEYGRFKDLLRRLIAVPQKEVGEKMAEYRGRREAEKANPEPET